MSIVWSPFLFDGPCRLQSWGAPRVAGIFAILRARRPTDPPPGLSLWDEYYPIYIGQSADLASEGLPMGHRLYSRWLAEAGDADNLFIAVYPMPDSATAERVSFERRLVQCCWPSCVGWPLSHVARLGA